MRRSNGSITLKSRRRTGSECRRISDGHLSPRACVFLPPTTNNKHRSNSRTDRCHQNTVAGWEEKARNLSRLAAETEERKRALIAERGSRADILKANRRLKSIREEIAATRRFLEPLVMSCPFCLWNCSPLFSADDAEAEEHDLANLGPSSPRAACSSSSPETVAGDAESVVDTYVNPLAAVMGSLPLKEAFGEYCQKEYCSEVCMYVCKRYLEPPSTFCIAVRPSLGFFFALLVVLTYAVFRVHVTVHTSMKLSVSLLGVFCHVYIYHARTRHLIARTYEFVRLLTLFLFVRRFCCRLRAPSRSSSWLTRPSFRARFMPPKAAARRVRRATRSLSPSSTSTSRTTPTAKSILTAARKSKYWLSRSARRMLTLTW